MEHLTRNYMESAWKISRVSPWNFMRYKTGTAILQDRQFCFIENYSFKRL